MVKHLPGRVSSKHVLEAIEFPHIRFTTVEKAVKPERTLGVIGFCLSRVLPVSQVMDFVLGRELIRYD